MGTIKKRFRVLYGALLFSLQGVSEIQFGLLRTCTNMGVTYSLFIHARPLLVSVWILNSRPPFVL
jgi:hypothetical protein